MTPPESTCDSFRAQHRRRHPAGRPGRCTFQPTTGSPPGAAVFNRRLQATVLTGGDFELTGGFWRPAERIPNKPDVTPEPPEPLEEEYEESTEEPLPPP